MIEKFKTTDSQLIGVRLQVLNKWTIEEARKKLNWIV